MRQQTIKGKITLHVILLSSISLVLLGGVSIYLNYSSTKSTLKQNMAEAASLAAEGVENRLLASQNIVSGMGADIRLSAPDTPADVKKEILDRKASVNGCMKAGILDTQGTDIFDGTDMGGYEFFQAALQGEVHVSEPILNADTGKTEIYVGAPLWADAVEGGAVLGVVYMVAPELYLDNIVSGIHVSSNGSAYMLDRSGYTIAHTNHDQVVNRENTIEDAKTDPSLRAIAEIEQKMISGEEGFGTYTYGGVSKFTAYAPIAGTNGWSIAVNAPMKDFMGSTVLGIVITAVILAGSLIFTWFRVRGIAAGIGNPIRLCAERLTLLAQGDVHSQIPLIESNDETGILAKSTRDIVESMTAVIQDISNVLGHMGEGDFTVRAQAEEYYIGDFSDILTAEKNIIHKLSSTMTDIRDTADQVSLGASQLAESSQSLAEGATDQAGSVQELLAAVTDVTQRVMENSQDADTASRSARQMGEEARQSTGQMRQMEQAMRRINDKSDEIANIISSIEEIASETNLLSLNASIEAARAGEAGRGFAVVAREISTLANQSAEAVVNTRELIEDTIREVHSGDEIVKVTSSTLQDLIDGLEKVVKAIESVGEASKEQADMISRLNMGIEQISGVIQSNSAAAQESSATSDELSAQASELNDLVGQFKV